MSSEVTGELVATDAEWGAPGKRNQPPSPGRPRPEIEEVRVEYINLDSIMSVLFTNLESCTNRPKYPIK